MWQECGMQLVSMGFSILTLDMKYHGKLAVSISTLFYEANLALPLLMMLMLMLLFVYR
jgi:hypothetical protein